MFQRADTRIIMQPMQARRMENSERAPGPRVPFLVMPGRLCELGRMVALSGPGFPTWKMWYVEWSRRSFSAPDQWMRLLLQHFLPYILYSALHVQTERIFILDDLDFILDFNNFICIELYKYFESIVPPSLPWSTKLPCQVSKPGILSPKVQLMIIISFHGAYTCQHMPYMKCLI